MACLWLSTRKMYLLSTFIQIVPWVLNMNQNILGCKALKPKEMLLGSLQCKLWRDTFTPNKTISLGMQRVKSQLLRKWL
jgi:hypothetical protein